MPPNPSAPPKLLREYFPCQNHGLSHQLEAGWNLVSFPYGKLSKIRGLTHALLSLGPQGWSEVDPNSQLEKIQPVQGFLAYCDAPETIEVEGETGKGPLEKKLSQGWNLIGCPTPLATQLAETDAGLVSLASPTTPSYAKFWKSGQKLEPFSAYWVYVEHPTTVRWGASQVNTTPDRQTVSSRITGKVTDNSGRPLVGAKIWGPSGYVRSDRSGQFMIDASDSGALNAKVEASNFETRRVQIRDGANISLKRKVSTIEVSIYSFQYNNCEYRPYLVRIWEYGNYARRYYQTFYYSSYRNDVVWQSFPQGKEYRVELIWRDSQGNQLSQIRSGTANSSWSTIHAYNSWTW